MVTRVKKVMGEQSLVPTRTCSLDQVTLRNNRGRNGGAIYVENLADVQNSFFNSVSVYITESVLDSNNAVNGGAVLQQQSAR